MGIKRQYILNVNVESAENVEPMEELLQEILLDLYESGGIESIHVIDNNDAINADDDLQEILNVLSDIDARDVMRSIEVVREMEDRDDE